MPPVLAPPMFGLPEAGAGSSGTSPSRAAPPSEYTMVMQAQVKPVQAAASRDQVPAPVAAAPASRLTMPVILMINGVILLTLVLILYFAFRSPPTAAPSLNGAKAMSDSATTGGTDSSGGNRDTTAR